MGLADLYEALLGPGLRVAVRAVPHSQTAVRLLDLVPAGDTVDAQNLIVISHYNSSLRLLDSKRTEGICPRDNARGDAMAR
jgi:hypothetical protein